jgi:hypothetical protein
MTTTVETPVVKKYNPTYKLYKRDTKDFSRSGASSWEWNPEKGLVFLTVAKQSQAGEVFDWKNNSQIFKLELVDLGGILNVFSGKDEYLGGVADADKTKSTIQKGKGLYHQANKDENAILKIYKITQGGFGLELSTKKSGKSFWGGHRISPAEATILKVILEDIVKKMYYFGSKA